MPDLQFRAFRMDTHDVTDEGHFVGHSNVFGVEDSYETFFDKGCFAKTIKDHGGLFPVLWFHNPREPISLAEHSEDDKGLRVEGDLDLDIETGRRVRSGMKKGYIDCMSIGFRVVSDATVDEKTHFKEVKLWESSLLTRNFAATPGADVDDIRMLPEVLARIGALSREAGPEELAAATAEFEGLLDLLQVLPDDGRPYPNEHSCVLRAPGQFQKFRRMKRKSGGKVYYIILGQRKDDPEKWEEQAYRYPKDVWSEAEARKHCKEHEGKKFEPALKDNALAITPEPSSDTLGHDEPQEEAGEPGDHSLVEGLRNVVDAFHSDAGRGH